MWSGVPPRKTIDAVGDDDDDAGDDDDATDDGDVESVAV